MAATVIDRNSNYSEGKLKRFLVAASTKIYKESLVGLNSTGYLVSMSDATGLTFVGVAFDAADNSAGNDADKGCRVRSSGEYDFIYAGTATQAKEGLIMYAQDNQTVSEVLGGTTYHYPVGLCVEYINATTVRLNIGGFAAPATVLDSSITPAKLSTNAKTFTETIQIEDLAAGADFAARAEFVAPTGGCTITRMGIIPKGASAGVDDGNTAVLAVACTAGAIITKTYNTATQPPGANTYGALTPLTNTALPAHDVVTVAVTQGATADLPAFLLQIEWQPAA